MSLEKASFEFDGWRSLHSGLSLSGCGLGFAAGLVRSDGRLEAGFELWGGTDHDLESGRVQGADPHQVLERKVVQTFGDRRGRRDGRFIQEVGDECGHEERQQLDPCNSEIQL